MISGTAQGIGDGIDQPGGMVHHIGLGRQDQCDDIGLARPQTHARTVRPIPQRRRGFTNPALGLLADIGRILQRAADRGHGKAGCRRDGLQRRPLCLRIGSRGSGGIAGQGHGATTLVAVMVRRGRCPRASDSSAPADGACAETAAMPARNSGDGSGISRVMRRCGICLSVLRSGGQANLSSAIQSPPGHGSQAKRLLAAENYNVIEIAYNVLETGRNG